MNKHLAELAALATQIALEAPISFSEHGHHTYVRRSYVTRIRLTLDAAGVDWRKHAKQLRKEAAARARRVEPAA